MRRLLQQLVYQLKTIPDSLICAYDLVRTKGSNFEPDYDTLSKLLSDSFTQFSTVYVILDALDECVETERSKIATILQNLPKSQLRLFITGRENAVDYKIYFENPDPTSMYNWLKGATTQPIIAAQEDIRRYLEDELAKIETDSTQESTELKKRIMEEICSQEHEQYLPPYFVADNLDFCLPGYSLSIFSNCGRIHQS